MATWGSRCFVQLHVGHSMELDIKGVKQGDRSVVITMREVDVNKQR